MRTNIDTVTPRGTIILRHLDKDGKVKEERTVKNLIVTVGRALQAYRLIGTTKAAVTHLALGTGIVAAAAANTLLGAETHRGAVTPTIVTTTNASDTAQFAATFVFDDTFAITEAALLNADAVGDMLSRQVFAAINVVNLDALEVIWKIQY